MRKINKLTAMVFISLLAITFAACDNPMSDIQADKPGEDGKDSISTDVITDDNGIVIVSRSTNDESCWVSGNFTTGFGKETLPGTWYLYFENEYYFRGNCMSSPVSDFLIDNVPVPETAISGGGMYFKVKSDGSISYSFHEAEGTVDIVLSTDGDGTEEEVAVTCDITTPYDGTSTMIPMLWNEDDEIWKTTFTRVVTVGEVVKCNLVKDGAWPKDGLYVNGVEISKGTIYEEGGFTLDFRVDKDGVVTPSGTDLLGASVTISH